MLKTRFLQEMKKLKQSIDIVEQMLIRSPESIPTHIHARFSPNAEAETRVSHDSSRLQVKHNAAHAVPSQREGGAKHEIRSRELISQTCYSAAAL